MSIPSISHPFYDFEVERTGAADEVYLVKILSIDGRRFTYEVRSALTEDAIAYVKHMIDSIVFSDLIIEKTPEGFEAREATGRLKKHS
jgi:hypothetical protein